MNLSEKIENLTLLEKKIRLGRNVESGLEIVAFLESLVPEVSKKSHEVQKEYQLILEMILRSQQSGDWLAVADSLAYELVHYLKRNISD